MSATLLLLTLIIVLAHFVETVTGFGATVIALALGVYVMSLNDLLVTLVMLGLLQSVYLVAIGYRHIEVRLLLRKILPLCGLGLAAGVYVSSRLETPLLQRLLGAFVMAVAFFELGRLLRRQASARSLNPIKASALLLAAGIFHGIFASGGPLIVYYTSREIDDKRVFRATLSLLWLVLNSVLLVTFIAANRFNSSQAMLAGQLSIGLVAGISLGEMWHHRIDMRTFRLVVQGVLIVTGIVLVM